MSLNQVQWEHPAESHSPPLPPLHGGEIVLHPQWDQLDSLHSLISGNVQAFECSSDVELTQGWSCVTSLGSNSVTVTDLWLGGDASGNKNSPAPKNNLRLTTQTKRNSLQVPEVTVQLRTEVSTRSWALLIFPWMLFSSGCLGDPRLHLSKVLLVFQGAVRGSTPRIPSHYFLLIILRFCLCSVISCNYLV